MKRTLRKKAILGILILASLLALVAIIVSYTTYSGTMDKHYMNNTRSIADTTAIVIDKNNVKKYVEFVNSIYLNNPKPDFKDSKEEENYYKQYENVSDESYKKIVNQLDEIRKANDILSLYIISTDSKSKSCVYVMDASTPEFLSKVGQWDIIYENNYNIFSNPKEGFKSYITNTKEYGWLCSAGSPIIDDNGDVIAYVMVDISMDEVMRDRYMFLAELCISLILLTGILLFIFIKIVNNSIVNPINSLAKMARRFVESINKSETNKDFVFSKLKIKSGDEIEELFHSIQFMEKEIYNYIDNLSNITAEKERISAELNVATQIQANMLPSIYPAFPERKEFDIFATMNPAKEVGGDFYDFFMIDDKHIAIVIADVSGKGVPAALFMVIGKTLIKDHTRPNCDLGEVFTKVNNLLCESNSENLFITAFEGILNLETGEFRFVNAGHEIPYICKRNDVFKPYKVKPGFVLAGMEDIKYKEDSIILEEGDKIFLYTDGVTEAINFENELYGSNRLNNVLVNNSLSEPCNLLKTIKEDIDYFVLEKSQFDDITMLCLEYKKKMR